MAIHTTTICDDSFEDHLKWRATIQRKGNRTSFIVEDEGKFYEYLKGDLFVLPGARRMDLAQLRDEALLLVITILKGQFPV